MASFRLLGPYSVKLKPDEWLAPGKSIDTFWLGWNPEPGFGKFTATVTAHPSVSVAGATTIGNIAANRLSVSDTTIEYVPTVDGDLVFTKLIIHAKVVNNGPATIDYFTICISVVEL
jgi:hypothetical protein